MFKIKLILYIDDAVQIRLILALLSSQSFLFTIFEKIYHLSNTFWLYQLSVKSAQIQFYSLLLLKIFIWNALIRHFTSKCKVRVKIHVSISVWSFLMLKKMIHCGICQVEFLTKQTLKRHFRRKHNKWISFCHCNKIFYSLYEKTLHRINFHKFIFKCKYCERTFKQKRSLNRHVKWNHNHLQLNNVISPINIKPSKSSSTSNSLAMSSKSEKQMTSSALVQKSKRGIIVLRLKGIYTVNFTGFNFSLFASLHLCSKVLTPH